MSQLINSCHIKILNILRNSIKPNLFISFILITLWVNPAVCEDDPYLQELNAEAESTVKTQETSQISETSKKQDLSTKELQTRKFETRLSNQLPSTYKTYRMLSAEQKALVVEAYISSDNSMPAATRILFNLYFKVR